MTNNDVTQLLNEECILINDPILQPTDHVDHHKYLITTLLLHQSIFKDDLNQLKKLIKIRFKFKEYPNHLYQYDINSHDRYSNTPLMIAVQMGRIEHCKILSEHGANARSRNLAGFSILSEAISRGDRELLKLIWESYKQQTGNEIDERTPALLNRIAELGDIVLKLDWRFKTSIPFLSGLLPKDTYTISVKKSQMRVDTTLIDIRGLRWIRGNVSYLFKLEKSKKSNDKQIHHTRTAANQKSASKLTSKQAVLKDYEVNVFALDHDNKTWCRLSEPEYEIGVDENESKSNPASQSPELSENNIVGELKREFEEVLEAEEQENELDDLMVSPIQSVTQPGELEFEPVKGSWMSSFNPFARKTMKIEKVGIYDAQVYSVKNIQVLNIKRFEHLSSAEKEEILEFDNALKDQKKLNQRFAESQADNGDNPRSPTRRGLWRRRRLQHLRRKEPDGETFPQSADEGDSRLIDDDDYQHRQSLPPPPPSSVTFDQYFANNYVLVRHEHYNEAVERAKVFKIKADDGEETSKSKSNDRDDNYGQKTDQSQDDDIIEVESESINSDEIISSLKQSHLGRPLDLKIERKKYSATLWITNDFPITSATLLDLLRIAAPNHKQVKKLSMFVSNKLPGGSQAFPVKLQIPIFHVLSAIVAFEGFEKKQLDQSMFEIPSDYAETSNIGRFQGNKPQNNDEQEIEQV